MTQLLSWPWIFFINVPVGVAAFMLSLRLVPESKDEAAHRSFDVPGAITVTGGLMALVYAIVQTEQKGWGSAQTIVTFIIAVALLVGFVLIELRAKAPLVRLSIFRVRSLSAANVVMFLVGSAFRDVLLQLAVHPAGARLRPAEGGLAFLPFTAGIMLSAGLASQFGPKVGVRLVAAIGMVVAAGGLLLLTRIPVDGSYVSNVLPSLLLTSLGMGAVFVPLTLVATTGLEDEDQGLASGLFNTSQQVGGALGLAILSTIAASHTHSDTPAQLVRGFHWAFAGSAVFVLAGLVALVTMLRQRDVARIEEEMEHSVTIAA